MDADTYGRLVERGGYATGGTVRLADVSTDFVNRLLASGPNPFWWPKRDTVFGRVTIDPDRRPLRLLGLGSLPGVVMHGTDGWPD